MTKHAKRYSTIILVLSLLLGFLTMELTAQEATPENRNISPPPMTEVPNLNALNKPSTVWDYLPRFITQVFEPKFDDTNSPGPLGEGKPAEEMSIFLDGESGYLRIPNSPSLNLSSRFTIEAWICPADITTANGIIEKNEKGVGGFSLRLSPQGVLELQVTGAGPDALEHAMVGKSVIAGNEWRHVAITHSGGEIYLYLDGKLEAQASVQSLNLINSADLTIGLTRSQEGKERFFKGTIDEIRISNFARYTENFIPEKYLYGGGIFGQIAGAWRFSDQKTEDTTGNTNHAVISGKAYFVQDPRSLTDSDSDTNPPELNIAPQSLINFDNGIATGQFLHNAYTDASFYETNGNPMYAWFACNAAGNPCAGQSLPHFANMSSSTQNVVFTFAQPVTLSRFDIIAVDEFPGSITNRISVKQDGVFYSFNVISSGWNVPLSINVGQLPCGQTACERATQIVSHTIFDSLGLGYDNFSYTIYSSPTPNPTPNCLTESSEDLDPCPPQPTPTPNIPNAPTNVLATPQERQVEITWDWFPSPNRPTPVVDFVVQRSDSVSGPWTTLDTVHPPTNHGMHQDFEGGIRVGVDKHYRVVARNQFGQSESETASAAPLSPCKASKTVPGGSSFNAHGWSGTVNFQHGLSVYNVSLKGRKMAEHMGVPSVSIPQKPNLTLVPSEEPGEYQITLEDYDQPQADAGKVSMNAKYCVTDETARNKWEITIQYDFHKRNPGDTCEPNGVLPCARYYPTVSFVYTSHKYIPPRAGSVSAHQRFHFRENGDVKNTFTFFRDCGGYIGGFSPLTNIKYLCTPLTYPISKSLRVSKETFDSGIDYRFQPPGYTFDSRATWDNFHQTGDDFIPEPGTPALRWAGCYSCVHSHWRWLNFGPLFGWGRPGGLTPDSTIFRAGSWLSGWKYRKQTSPYTPAKQNTKLSVVKYRPEEFNIVGPHMAQSNEDIYVSKKLNFDRHTEPGGDIVLWVTSDSYEEAVLEGELYKSTDIFSANGGFFAEVITRNQEKFIVDRNMSVYFPQKVKTDNVFVDTYDIFYTPVTLTGAPPLPSGYSYITPSGSPPIIAVTYGFLSANYVGTGNQEIEFKITDPTIDMQNLRVMTLDDDEDAGTSGWGNITLGTPNHANRTVTGKFNFVAGTGTFENNAKFFAVTRYTPQLSTQTSVSDLVVTGSVSPQPIRSGNNLTYSWTITNQGTETATAAKIRQQLDSNTNLVSATSTSGTCNDEHLHPSENSENIYCNLGDIQGGASVNVSVIVKVQAFGAGSGTEENIEISSKIFSTSTALDSNLENNDLRLTSIAQPSLNKPPLVAFVYPADEAIIVSPSNNPTTITIELEASDLDGRIENVEIFDNGSSIGLAQLAGGKTYIISLIAPTYGRHTITAYARDDLGRITGAVPVDFWVNSASTISIATPVNNILIPSGAASMIRVESNIVGSRLRKIELFQNGLLLGTLRQASNTGNMYSHEYMWNKIPTGRYTLTAILTEISGATSTSAPVEITADVPPTIEITSPNDGITVGLGSTIDFALTVGDSDGYVTRIDFFANGNLIDVNTVSIKSGTTSFRWNSPSAGIYSIVAVATDDLGVTGSSNPVNIGVNRPVASIGEMIWVDDGLPAGASAGGDDGWNWLNTNPAALMGGNAHQSLLQNGMHEHFFENASFKLQVNQGEKLSAWIFIDPDFPPAEVMLQWKSDQGWDHRAYWGQNLIDLGTDGTNSRRRIGDIPTSVGWKQLKIPANLVGLEGKLVNGMKFTVHGGRVAWDRVGKLLVSAPEPGPPNPDFVWIDDAPPAGSLLEAVHDTWTIGTWINFNPSPNTGSLSHRHWQNDFNEPYRQRSFSNAPSTMAVNPGDTLFAYVYLYSDPQYRPDTLLLQWLDDSSGWTHRAYWGRDTRDRIAAKVSLPGAAINTEGWRYMGQMPTSGGWVRLEVPASYVGLEGKNVKGMSFGVYQMNNKGRAVWDSAGRTSQPPTVQPVNLKYTTPLWRYRCGSGGGERLYYTTMNDHNFLHPDCTGKFNSGYVYGYGAPGTVPLHGWQNGEGRWLLNICATCTFPGWTYGSPVANAPGVSMTDTTPHQNWSCNNNHHYTSYPSPPDSLYPNNCTFIQTMNYSVHTR